MANPDKAAAGETAAFSLTSRNQNLPGRIHKRLQNWRHPFIAFAHVYHGVDRDRVDTLQNKRLGVRIGSSLAGGDL